MRAGCIRPALADITQSTISRSREAHTSAGDTGRTCHWRRRQTARTDHNLRYRIDITAGSVGRIAGTAQLTSRLANTIGNGIGQILTVRTAPAPTILGDEFRDIILNPDTGIPLPITADQGILLKDFVACAVKSPSHIQIEIVIPIPA